MKTIPAYKIKHKIAAIAMIATMAWLTASMPFVISIQKELAKQVSNATLLDTAVENEESIPLANSNEEKSPSSSSIFEDNLYHSEKLNDIFSYKLSHDNRHSYDLYVAFHGEILCPPPNFLS